MNEQHKYFTQPDRKGMSWEAWAALIAFAVAALVRAGVFRDLPW